MDVQLSNSVIGGYLSNEVPNLVTGVIYLAGRKDPIQVELQGNFLRDIAGCRVDFVNPLPHASVAQQEKLAPHQTGHAGEMTASRRIERMMKRNAPPKTEALKQSGEGLKNMMFLEWFNEQRQRVIIQAWHWHMKVSAPRWMSPAELEMMQLQEIRRMRKEFLLSRKGK